MLICSDIHFFAPNLHPWQLFSKESIGNVNALLGINRGFLRSHAETLIGQISKLDVSHVLILGDFTTTSSKKEFLLSKAFIANLQEKGITVLALPGNHDNYTKKAYQEKRFYQMFEDLIDFRGHSPTGCSLKNEKVAAYKITDGFWVVCLDTTIKTPPFNATGLFDLELEENLCKVLESIPKEATVALANHFPLICKKGEYHALKNRERLHRVLQNYPMVRYYLFGHEHHYEESKIDHLYTLSPGSLTLKNRASFMILDTNGKVEKHDLV